MGQLMLALPGSWPPFFFEHRVTWTPSAQVE
jgi:hypothetical protein